MPQMNPLIPTMLFDGDCPFCRHWVEKWRKIGLGKVVYKPYQQALLEFPQISEKQCQEAVQLILPDGRVLSGAHAVFTALAIAGRSRFLLRWYEQVPFFRRISQAFYRFVAKNRSWLPQL